MAEQNVWQRTKQLPSMEARPHRPTCELKMDRHTSSSETPFMTQRKPLVMVQTFTSDESDQER